MNGNITTKYSPRLGGGDELPMSKGSVSMASRGKYTTGEKLRLAEKSRQGEAVRGGGRSEGGRTKRERIEALNTG